MKLLENKKSINGPVALPYDSKAINVDLDRIYEYITRDEFKARIECYLECYGESVAADQTFKKTGTDTLGK